MKARCCGSGQTVEVQPPGARSVIAASLILLVAQAPAEALPLAPHNRITISAAMADVVMDAAVKDAVARQAAVAIVIVDENGEVVQSLRMDGVRSQFVEIARRKA